MSEIYIGKITRQITQKNMLIFVYVNKRLILICQVLRNNLKKRKHSDRWLPNRKICKWHEKCQKMKCKWTINTRKDSLINNKICKKANKEKLSRLSKFKRAYDTSWHWECWEMDFLLYYMGS